MKATQSQKRDFEGIAWGAIFVWWGIMELVPPLINGIGALGIGLILLGLNAARHYSGYRTSRFTITLGVLAMVCGGLEMADALLPLPFEMPTFAILLMVLGGVILARELKWNRNETQEELQ